MNTGVRTITEPPRVEKLTLPAALTQPCERTAPGLPDPATATNRQLAEFLPVLAGRLETCADQVDAIRAAVP